MTRLATLTDHPNSSYEFTDGGAAYLDGRIYRLAGQSHLYNHWFDLDAFAWDTSSGTDVPAPSGWSYRRGCVAIGAEGYVWVAGGYHSSSVTNRLERYTPGTDTWTAMAAMSTTGPVSHPRHGAGICYWDGHIYVVGGRATLGGSPQATILDYDISGDSWSIAGTMASSRYLPAVRCIDGVIYIFSSTTGEKFDIGTASFLTAPTAPPETLTGAPCALALDNRYIHIMGGNITRSAHSDAHYRYDTVDDDWLSSEAATAELPLMPDGWQLGAACQQEDDPSLATDVGFIQPGRLSGGASDNSVELWAMYHTAWGHDFGDSP